MTTLLDSEDHVCESRQGEGVEGASCCDGYVFFSIYRVGHGAGVDGSAHLEVPEGLAGIGVEGDEVAFGVAGEDEASSGGEDAGPAWGGVLEFLLDFAGQGIDGFQES